MIENHWYRNAVIYSLDLETFLDSDGDGVGDFEGLIRRIDYLQYLGIEAVWLAPFQPTPNRDNGYDVRDHYGVDPRHGTSGDFVEFMHHANRRGLKVLMDLVVNHTSDEHPWFRHACADPESRYRDWYVWSDEEPSDWDEGMVFPGVQERVWTWNEEAQAYYFHRFYEFQPDLNMDNPEVRAEIRRIIGYWLQLGVDGFRVDAVPFLIESVEPGGERNLHFEYLSELRQVAQWRRGDVVLLGEANVPPDESTRYFRPEGGEGLHILFNFYVNQHLFLALATGRVDTLIEAIESTQEVPPDAQWANFLRNHDELDLGRLTDEQRELVFERFAPEENMRLYGRGIRRRLATMLGDRKHEELAYSAMFSLPGTPVIRFGDELRMGDDLTLPERDAVRTPMQWANEPNAGFSTAEETVHPVIDEGVWSYRYVNVEAQRRDPDSFLNWIARMIRLRKECSEIGCGTCTVVDTGSPHILALQHEWRGNRVLAVHNFDEHAHEAHIRLEGPGASRLSSLLEEREIEAGADGEFAIPLESLGYRWFRLGGLDYAVRRERE
jgi:maltose alpha-D-glucosyltransferase / alpha-amylase